MTIFHSRFSTASHGLKATSLCSKASARVQGNEPTLSSSYMAGFNTRSNLAVLLLECFAKGELPATRVAKLAAAAAEDGWMPHDPLAQDLAKAGINITHTGNVLRNIVNAANRHGFLAASSKPYIFDVPGPGGEDVKQEIFLPTETYANLVASTDGDLTPWCLLPAQLAAPHGLGQTIQQWGTDVGVADVSEVGILGLHADGATYTSSMRAGQSKSVVVGSVNVISASDPRRRGRRHLLFVISKDRLCDCGCSGYHTYQAIFGVLAWNMTFLSRGELPRQRHDGSPWTAHDRRHRLQEGSHRAALLQLRGDWEWMSQCFRFPTATQERFCWMCEAHQSDGPCCFHDVTRAAPHRATLIDHRAFIESCAAAGQEPSTLFRCPGLKLQHVTVDSMHAGDLGVFADAMGSLLWLHISNKNYYNNMTVGLQKLNEQINEYYTGNRHRKLSRVTPLAYSQIKPKSMGFPYLKAKAAGCRHLADFGLALAHAHRFGGLGKGRMRFRATHPLHGQETAHNDLVVNCFRGLVDYHRACSASPFSPDFCKQSMYTFLESFIALHDMWRAAFPEDVHAKLPFHIRPKAHMLQHLVEEKIVLFGSPNAFWCYGDEDFVGVIKVVCSMSKHPATLEKRVAEKSMIMDGVVNYRLAHE